jgi:hypothetical protein
MDVNDLIGSNVWVRRRRGPEFMGKIASIPRPIVLDSIEATVTASTFRIELTSGDVIETLGVNILRIDHEGYQWATSGRRPGQRE